MAAPKTIPPSSELQPPLAPYEHKLNNNGTECVKDCPACHWDKRTSDAPWNLRKPPQPECCEERPRGFSNVKQLQANTLLKSEEIR
jgi:hypothetical protein